MVGIPHSVGGLSASIKGGCFMSCAYQSEIESIIVHGDAKTLVETAKKIAREMVVKKDNGKLNETNSVSTSQVRNIYGTSKKIEMVLDEKNTEELYNKLVLLKPKMAYVNGRVNKDSKKVKSRGLVTLVKCLTYAIDQINADYGRMQNFFHFFEAILAYHKAEGGK
jgi:CRISPR-associated protein Csm2